MAEGPQMIFSYSITGHNYQSIISALTYSKDLQMIPRSYNFAFATADEQL